MKPGDLVRTYGHYFMALMSKPTSAIDLAHNGVRTGSVAADQVGIIVAIVRHEDSEGYTGTRDDVFVVFGDKFGWRTACNFTTL